MNALFVLLLLAVQEDPIVIRTVEAPTASFPARELPEGEIGVALGAPADLTDLLSAAGFSASPASRRGLTFSSEPKAGTIWISSLSREQTAAALRDAKGIVLCIVTGRGGGDPEPLKIGDAWMVQGPGTSGLWGRIELRGGAVTNRFTAPDGKRSEKVAAAKKKQALAVDAVSDLRATAKGAAAAAAEAPAAFETANRACRLRILAAAQRPAYGMRTPPPGKRVLVLDAEFENTIPMTLVQSNQVPTIYRIKDLADHLYLVVNGNRVSRLYPDASSLPGHVGTTGFSLDRLGSRARGNLVYEIPAEGIERLDLRFYDYAHGHMGVVLRPGAPKEGKPIVPLQENDILEAGIFKAERVKELAGKAAPEGMTWLTVEFGARSRMFTEGDATAFDPKAKPGRQAEDRDGVRLDRPPEALPRADRRRSLLRPPGARDRRGAAVHPGHPHGRDGRVPDPGEGAVARDPVRLPERPAAGRNGGPSEGAPVPAGREAARAGGRGADRGDRR
jgi:hypothetical protein